MKAMILAAGYATRMYPLTLNFPKPLLEIGGSTILDRLVEDIRPIVDEIIVVTNHKFAQRFRDWAGDRATVLDDGSLTNETRLGAVRDMLLAARGREDDFLVMAGDNVLDFSLKSFAAYAAERGTSCLMRHYEADPERLRKTGVLTVNEVGRVLEMREKPAQPESCWACPPFYYYIREDLARLKEALSEGCPADAPGSFAAWLCRKTTVYAWEMKGRRYDIGSPESYEEVKKMFSRETEDETCCGKM